MEQEPLLLNNVLINHMEVGSTKGESLIYYACCCVILPNKVWQYKPSAMSFKCVTLYQFLNYNFGIAYFKAAVVLTIVG